LWSADHSLRNALLGDWEIKKTASWKLGQWIEGSCSGNEMRTGVPVSYRIVTHKGVTV